MRRNNIPIDRRAQALRPYSNGFRNFRMGIDDNFNFCIGDFGGGVSGNTWRSNDFTINYLNGNVGIGTVGQPHKLNVMVLLIHYH